MTVNSNREQLRPLVNDGQIGVMRNVMQFQRADGLSVHQPYAKQYVLDSGGYTAMSEFGGDFPWSVSEYHDWAARMYEANPFGWVAVMDLACEPAFDDDMTVDERIKETVSNTIDLLDCDPDYPVLPVLQGREIEDWLWCYDLLREHGIDPAYAGVGTLCRQTSGKQIKHIIRAIRSRTDIKAFHGFGVKATAFQHGAVFESADSQAWSWPVKYGVKLTYQDGSLVREPYSDDDENIHKKCFQAYYNHVSKLHKDAFPDKGYNQLTLPTGI
jgi:hypothetical protein